MNRNSREWTSISKYCWNLSVLLTVDKNSRERTSVVSSRPFQAHHNSPRKRMSNRFISCHPPATSRLGGYTCNTDANRWFVYQHLVYLQFSSVHDGIYALGKACTYSTQLLRNFTQRCLWNSSNVCLIDDGPSFLDLSRQSSPLPLSMQLSSRQHMVWCL